MRKRTAVIAAVAVLAIGGGVAYAAWSSTGSGNGSVSSTTHIDSTISPVDGSGGLYPGVLVNFNVMISNPNAYQVKVTSVGASSSLLVNGCAAGTVTSRVLTNPAGLINPGETRAYTLQAVMSVDASDACKSQTFTLPLSAQLVSATS